MDYVSLLHSKALIILYRKTEKSLKHELNSNQETYKRYDVQLLLFFKQKHQILIILSNSFRKNSIRMVDQHCDIELFQKSNQETTRTNRFEIHQESRTVNDLAHADCDAIVSTILITLKAIYKYCTEIGLASGEKDVPVPRMGIRNTVRWSEKTLKIVELPGQLHMTYNVIIFLSNFPLIIENFLTFQ